MMMMTMGVRLKKTEMMMVLRFVFNLGVRRMQKDLIERERLSFGVKY